MLALTDQIRQLVKKLDAPKKKDPWDVVSILTAFFGTVVVSGLSLYLTQSFQRLESQRTRDFQAQEADRAARFSQSQMEHQKAQTRVEELKAITALAPILASPDPVTRETGQQLLQAIKNSAANVPAETRREHAGVEERISASADQSMIVKFAELAMSKSLPTPDRVAATRRLGEIASAGSSTIATRSQAADLVGQIAIAADVPNEVKKAAETVLAGIKRVSADEVQRLIATDAYTREITEVILHHSTVPTSSYKGSASVLNLARNQLEVFRWSKIGFHYAIAPDGSIWLGAPLDQEAAHVPTGHNKRSVSVTLLLDGDKELPTERQRESLAVVLRALFTRLKIESPNASPAGAGFHLHREYDQSRSCPGKLLPKELILSWL